ncbi:hypothetical protein [Microbacterium sp. SLBN-146]|uniref:hypothetical protein n=1 Tax=Microbacterium sp. SLBN-146 TaxID=2768457 RepID=UPI00114E5003|nr:hypothetical protein [Microbacterium sp. SLBN-146]
MNLVFNGVGATITLATAIVAVVSFVIARRSRKEAAEAQRRADAARAVAEQATENEARTFGYLDRALRVVQQQTSRAEPLLDWEKELLAPQETAEELEDQPAPTDDAFNSNERPTTIRDTEGPDTIEKILADMKRDAKER